MSMLGSGLATAVKSAIAAIPNPKDHDAVWNAIGDAIVNYIIANAHVTVAVTSVSGVTTGAGVSGAGTGTGTIS